MDCKHPYYQLVNGQLVCVVCGKPAPAKTTIEDKIGDRPEVKLNVPPAKSGINIPKGKNRR
jgi:uncharacterized Zn finger protein (UPF0148 family)